MPAPVSVSIDQFIAAELCTTIVRTDEGKMVIIPSGLLSKSVIINATRSK